MPRTLPGKFTMFMNAPHPNHPVKTRTIQNPKEVEAVAIIARAVEVYCDMSSEHWPQLLNALEITSEELERIRAEQRRVVDQVFFEPTSSGEKRKFPDEFKLASARLSAGKRAAAMNAVFKEIFRIQRGQIKLWAEENEISLPLLRSPNGSPKSSIVTLSTKDGKELSEEVQQDIAIVLHGIEATFTDAKARIQTLLHTVDIHGQTAAAIKRRYPNTIEFQDNAKQLQRKRFPDTFKSAVARLASGPEAQIFNPALKQAIGTSRTQLVQWGEQVGLEIPRLREPSSVRVASTVAESQESNTLNDLLQRLYAQMPNQIQSTSLSFKDNAADIEHMFLQLLEEKQDLQTRNDTLQSEQDELTALNTALQSELDKMHQQNAQNTRVTVSLSQQVSRLEQEVSSLQIELETAEKAVKDAQQVEQSTQNTVEAKNPSALTEYVAAASVIEEELPEIGSDDLIPELIGIIEAMRISDAPLQDEPMQHLLGALQSALEVASPHAEFLLESTDTLEIWNQQLHNLRELTNLAGRHTEHTNVAVLLAAVTHLANARFEAWQHSQANTVNDAKEESKINGLQSLMGVQVTSLVSTPAPIAVVTPSAVVTPAEPVVPTSTPNNQPKVKYAKTLAQEQQLDSREIKRRDMFMDAAMHLSIAQTNYYEVVERVVQKIGKPIIKHVIEQSGHTFTSAQRETLLELGLQKLPSVFDRMPVASPKTNIFEVAVHWLSSEFAPTLQDVFTGKIACQVTPEQPVNVSETQRLKDLNSALFRLRFYEKELYAKIRAAVAKNDRTIKSIAGEYATKAGDATFLPFATIYDEAKRLAEVVIEQWDGKGNFYVYFETALRKEVKTAANELARRSWN